VQIPLDYYRMLGVPLQAEPEAIARAYRDRTCQQLHPEYSEAAVSARQQLLADAFAVLDDPEQRASYDAQLLGVAVSAPETVESEAIAPEPPAAEIPEASASEPEPSASELTESESAGDPSAEADALPDFWLDDWLDDEEWSDDEKEWSDDDRTDAIAAEDSERAPAIARPEPVLEVDDARLGGALAILLELGDAASARDLVEWRIGTDGIETLPGDWILSLAIATWELGREQWQQQHYGEAAELHERAAELARIGSFAQLLSEIDVERYRLRPYLVLALLAPPNRNEAQTRRALQVLESLLRDRGGIDGHGDDRSGLDLDNFLGFIQRARASMTAQEQYELFASEARRPSAAATYLTACTRLAIGFSQRQPQMVAAAQVLFDHLATRQDVELERAICALLLGQTETALNAVERSDELEAIAEIRRDSRGAPDLLPGLCHYAERWLGEELFANFRDLRGTSTSLQAYFTTDAVAQSLVAAQMAAEAPAIATRQGQQQDLAAVGTQARYGTQAATAVRSGRVATLERPLALAAGGGGGGDSYAPVPPGSGAHRPSRRAPRRRSEFVRSGGVADLPPEATPLAPRPEGTRPRRRGPRRATRATANRRLLALGAAGLAGIGVFGLLAVGAVRVAQQAWGGPRLEGEQLAIRLDRPVLELPPAEAAAVPVELDRDAARAAIRTWFESKARAFGPEHELAALDAALAEPALSNWRSRAAQFAQQGLHQEFQHEIADLEILTQTGDRARVQVAVTEIATAYRGGQRVERSSYNSQLLVRYDLVRQPDGWQIRGSELVD